MLSPPLLQVKTGNSQSQDSLGEGLEDGETAHQMRKKTRQFKVAALILVPLFNHLVAEQSLK